jgi:hypothetical protein
MAFEHDAYPLRRLPSRSSTIDNENPFETASILSSAQSTSASLLSHASTSTLQPSNIFIPSSKLQIQNPGHRMWAFPVPPKTLETPVFTLSSENKCERPRWISIRPERSKGNCYLVNADDETGTSIARTTYRFGPGKDPRVRIGGDGHEGEEFEMVSRWITRATSFLYAGRRWEWRYGDKRERKRVQEESGEECNSLLILDAVSGEERTGKRRQAARLIRGEDSRTPGSKKTHAGNGGRLEICLPDADAPNDREERWNEGLTEVVVVVTALVMLKKEIDRMRSRQIVTIGG